MAFDIVQLTEIHLLCLSTRRHTGNADLKDKDARRILLSGEAFAVTDRGEVFGAAGIFPLWHGVGHGWAILTVPTGCKRLIWFTRQVKRYLGECDMRRVQTTVAIQFSQGLAWATHLLAFEPEGIMRGYDEAGGDHIMLAQVRPLDGTNAHPHMSLTERPPTC